MAQGNKNGKKPKQSESERKCRIPRDAAEAKEILCRFVVRARRVEAHSMVQNHSIERYINPSMKMECRGGQPVQIKYTMPDQEIFESLAARTRPCILASEPVYLDKVFRSIDLLLGGRQPAEDDLELLHACRKKFRDLCDKKDGASYFVQTYDEDGSPKGKVMPDLLIGEGWMYGDLVHADPKGEKAEAMNLQYRDRFFAGTSFFSLLALIVVRTLELVTDFNEPFGFGIDKEAWEEQVVVTERDQIVSDKMVLLPYGAEPSKGVDPSTLPGAVDATSLTELRRAIQPSSAADAVFLHEEEPVDKVHAVHSWKDGILTVLVTDALLLEFDTTDLQNGTASVRGSLTPNSEAVERLWPIMQRSDRVLILIPDGNGGNFIFGCLLSAVSSDAMKNVNPVKG